MGLAAGIAPGPLLMLVISETLKGNKINGIVIALSPLLTDLPIILISVYLLTLFSSTDFVLGILSISGGVFLIHLGIQNFRSKPQKEKQIRNYKHSIRNGMITNVLSPHPYLFWITIGAPMIIRAAKISINAQILFILGFYSLLIGSKVVVALISDRIKGFISSYAYKYIMMFMGLILLALASIMIFDGVSLLEAN